MMRALDLCQVEGCKKRVDCHRLCSSHAHRLRRYGNPLGGSRSVVSKSDMAAFLAPLKPAQDDACVIWPFLASPMPP